MSGTHYQLTVEDREVIAAMARHAAAGTGPLLPRLGEYLQASTEARFKTQTDPSGAAWKPLEPSYARSKKYHKDKILTLRGYLRSGIHYQLQGENTVAIGSNTKYAAIHQFGGKIEQPSRQATLRFRSKAGRMLFAGKKHKRFTEKAVSIAAYEVTMPARPFLGISTADDGEIRDIIQTWVMTRGAG